MKLKNCLIPDTWSTPIEKLMLWRTNCWMKYESECERLVLRLCYDQLLIITPDSKILESLNLHGKVKGIFKDDILIMFISLSGKEVSIFFRTFISRVYTYLLTMYLGYNQLNYNLQDSAVLSGLC